MADDSAAAAPSTRPQKPDENLYKENLAKADKEHTQAKTQYEAIKKKIELANPGRNPENPTQKKRQELIARLNEIRQKQGAGKNSRTAKLDQVKSLDDQLKAKTKELKSLQESTGVRNQEELDRKIASLQANVDSGKMKLVDEKKTLDDINKLNRSRKQFAELEKKVEGERAKIAEIKASMNDPETKALSEEYTKLQAELDGIKAEQDEAKKSIDSLYAERNKLRDLEREKYKEVRRIKDEFYDAKKKFGNYEREQKQKAWERQKAERERIEKERKKERAQKMLAEAGDKAYLDEIRRANSLLHFFDPSFVPEKTVLKAESGLQAQPERKVDDSGIKGVKLVGKNDLDEEYMPAVKKGKKGKKSKGSATKSTYNCPPSVVEDCAAMGIDPPMSADEVPAAIEKVKAKLDHWKSDQEAQTQRNIDKAKKEIEKLEAEEAAEKEGKKSSSGTATPNGNAKENGDKAVDDVAKDVAEKATIDDKKEAVAAA